MTTEREIAPTHTLEQDRLSDELTGSFTACLSRAAHGTDDSGLSLPLKQKPVKPRPVKKPSSVEAAVHEKEFAMYSQLSKS
jgi:hypothetical protein